MITKHLLRIKVRMSIMEITYDKKADAMYIEFQKGEFFKNKNIKRHTF